ncbi:MAG: type IVB secretion system protein IcmH/DotU [Thiolinea sp.]
MNANDDPFFSSGGDRTIIRPVPGGRVQDLQRQTGTVFNEPSGPAVPLGRLSKLNPLDNAASSLLALIANLYHSPSHSSPKQLKNQLIQEIKSFEATANQADLDKDMIQKARYALCTTIDEAIFNTPWGRQSGWSEHGLLSMFHNEVSGGKRFFQMLQESGQNPSKNLYLLELMYVCLALGFQGRYRLDSNGREKLEQIRAWLADLIRQNRKGVERLLSPHWQGVQVAKSGFMRLIPTWVFFAVAAALVLLLYMALWLALGSRTEPVYAGIERLNMDVVVNVPEFEPPPPPQFEAFSRQWLQQEIKDGLVIVHDGKNKIEIRGDKGLFESGSDELLPRRVKLVQKIADALASPEFGGSSYLVIGHTDNVPLRTSVRFANNWELSRARADAVKKALLKQQPGLSLRTKGKADIEPIADNKNKTGRARNRRVDIVLE